MALPIIDMQEIYPLFGIVIVECNHYGLLHRNSLLCENEVSWSARKFVFTDVDSASAKPDPIPSKNVLHAKLGSILLSHKQGAQLIPEAARHLAVPDHKTVAATNEQQQFLHQNKRPDANLVRRGQSQ